jgi:hypothetical protein
MIGFNVVDCLHMLQGVPTFVSYGTEAATGPGAQQSYDAIDAVSVRVPDYPAEFGVPIAFLPELTVSISPGRVARGTAETVTVSCRNAATLAPVAGRVFINGVDRAATNVAFTFTGSEAVAVRVPGYPEPAPVSVSYDPSVYTSAAAAAIGGGQL